MTTGAALTRVSATPSNPRERALSENQPFRASDTTFFAAS
mgnify:CR=1 FL=1